MYLVYETLWLHLGYSPFRRRLIISATSVCVNCRLDIGFICEPFKPFWNSAGKSLLGRWHRFKAFAIFAIKSFTIATASGCRIKSSRIRIQWSLFLTKLSGSMLLQPSLTTVSYCMYYLIHCVRKDKMPPMLAWGVRHRDLMSQGPPEWMYVIMCGMCGWTSGMTRWSNPLCRFSDTVLWLCVDRHTRNKNLSSF